MSFTTELLLVLALAIANGIFSGAEIAVLSVRKSRLGELAAEGNTSAKRVLQLRESPERFLATVQVGITLIGATAAAFGGATLTKRLAAVLHSFGFGSRADTIAFTCVILFVSFVSLVLGELVPKSLALRNADRFATMVASPMLVLASVARPLVWLLTGSSNLILKLFGDQTSFTEARLSPDELQQLVEDAATEGSIEPVAGEIASRALDFGRLRVAALMLPRAALQSVDANLDGSALGDLLIRTTSDRLPVHEDSADNVTGYVTLRDALIAVSRGQALRSVARAAYFVPEFALAVDTLREMQRRQVHLAVVVDEVGLVVGFVTLEELVEELVGEIFSEHEKPTQSIHREAEGVAIVHGNIMVRDA